MLPVDRTVGHTGHRLARGIPATPVRAECILERSQEYRYGNPGNTKKENAC